MRMYTSYFAMLPKLLAAGVTPISICRFPPGWYDGAAMMCVSPTPETLSRMKSGDVSARADYVRDTLFAMDAKDVVADAARISGGKDVAFLCFEKPGDFCHRQLFGRWLIQSGYHVEEFRDSVELF